MFESTYTKSAMSGSGNSSKLRFVATKDRKSIEVRIPISVINKAGIKNGDRVDILINTIEQKGAISVSESGWLVRPITGSKSYAFKYCVFDGCLAVKETHKTSIPNGVNPTPGRIIFDMPESMQISKDEEVKK